MPIAPPTIVAIPEPPSTADPANFDARGDAYLGVFPELRDDLQEVADVTYDNAVEVFTAVTDIAGAALVATDAAGLVGKMSGSLTVSAGTKAITLVAAKSSLAVANKQVAIVLDSDRSIMMLGVIPASPAPTSTAFSVTVTSGGVSAAGAGGTFSGWMIIDAKFLGAAATAAEIWAGETDTVSISPKGQTDAGAPVAVSWASTLVLDLKAGRYRRMTACSASFTLGIPTNAKAGQWFVLDLLNSAGSIVLAANAAWDWRGQLLGVLNPNNGARNKIVGIIDEVDGSGNMTRGTAFVIAGIG